MGKVYGRGMSTLLPALRGATEVLLAYFSALGAALSCGGFLLVVVMGA